VGEILRKKHVELPKHNFARVLHVAFGIACDEISGHKLDFDREEKPKCRNCSSAVFDETLAEPKTIITVNVPLVTHVNWMAMDENEKVRRIEAELNNQGII
jgi:hypothetical protein